jgi:hypothetical protein
MMTHTTSVNPADLVGGPLAQALTLPGVRNLTATTDDVEYLLRFARDAASYGCVEHINLTAHAYPADGDVAVAHSIVSVTVHQHGLPGWFCIMSGYVPLWRFSGEVKVGGESPSVYVTGNPWQRDERIRDFQAFAQRLLDAYVSSARTDGDGDGSGDGTADDA